MSIEGMLRSFNIVLATLVLFYALLGNWLAWKFGNGWLVNVGMDP